MLGIPKDCARMPNINSVGIYPVTPERVELRANCTSGGSSLHVLLVSFSMMVSKHFKVLTTRSI